MIGTTITPLVGRDERWRARRKERPLFQLASSDSRRSRRRSQHHSGVAVSPSYILCLVVCLGVYALSLWDGRKSGPAQPAVPLRTLIRPEATGASFECVRAARPQQHLHQVTVPAAVVRFRQSEL